MNYRLLLILLGLLAVPVLAYGQASINVESVSTAPGGTTTIDVTVSAVPAPGVTDFQGTFAYNPAVVHVTNIVGLNGFSGFFFKNINNVAGTAAVSAAIVGGPGLTAGDIFRLTVQAVGAAGDSSAINLTVAVFRDANGNNIPRTVTPGTFTISAVTNNPPTAAFTYTPVSPVVNQTVTFTDASTDTDGNIVAWNWNFGDGGISTLRNPTHQYTNGGTYTVTLTVTDDDGATGSTSQTVAVTGPSAAFTYTPPTPTTQDPVQFLDQSTTPTGNIVTWNWNFGDGGASGLQNPTHTFATPGTYRVTLTITTSAGATVSTFRDITVRNAPPTAAFTFNPAQPRVGQMVTFSAGGSTDPDGRIVLFEWDFNSDGNYEIAGATATTVTRAFNVNGQHRVTLRVTDNAGAWDTETQIVPVGVNAPTAAFNFNPATPKVRQAIRFDGSPSTDPDGTIVLYEWDLNDDGVTDATGVTITHSYNNAGNYRVTLTVTDNDGLQHAVTRQVPVGTTPPVAAFTFTPANPRIGEAVTFNASASNDPDGRIVSYEWDYPDVAGNINDTGVTVNHAFNAAGTYRVTLTVRDDDGNQAIAIGFVPVRTTPPVARVTFTPATPNTGQVVTFDGSTSTDADGTIIQYRWNLGDGSPVKTGMAITHAYNTPGVYPVTLTVTDNDGAIDVTTVAVPVEVGGVAGVNQLPVANFTFQPAQGPTVNLNEVVTFKAAGSSDPDGTIEAYEWDFNNDGVYDATGTTASHVYHTGGSKIVTLRVTDNVGGRGFKTRVVSVEFTSPTARFTYTPTKPKTGEVVSFDGSASTDPDGRVEFYEWDFNNDGICDATGKFVNHAFDVGGSQPVTLKVTDNDGVTDHTTQAVTVAINTPPAADFTYSPASPTTADTVVFTDLSKDDGTIVKWLWDFGDGTTSDVQSPSHKYGVAKTYTVKLAVTDNDGASGNVSKDIIVREPPNRPPVAKFDFTPMLPQVNQVVQFNDQSTDPDGTVKGWNWTFGDGGTSTAQNPTHAYASIGTYTVTLTVTDNKGASSAPVSKEITVAKVGADIMTYSYPNPASTQATIVYLCPAGATDITLRVFDIVGALVFSTELSSTVTEYLWNLRSAAGDSLPNGLYFYLITANSNGRTIRSEKFKLLIAR